MKNHRNLTRLTALLLLCALLLVGCQKQAFDTGAAQDTAAADPSAPAVTSADDAVQVLSDRSEEYGYENALSELTLQNETAIDGDVYYRLQQNYNGIPVYGRSAVYAADAEGQQLAVTGNVADIADLSLTPQLSAEEAVAACKQSLEAESRSAEFLLLSEEDSLCIYNLNGHADCLAYQALLSENGEFFKCLIDAQTGELLLCSPTVSYDTGTVVASGKDVDRKTVSFNVYREDENSEYQLWDKERNILVYDAHGETLLNDSVHFQDPDGNWIYFLNSEFTDADGNPVECNGITLTTVEWDFSTEENKRPVEICSSEDLDWNNKKAVSAMSRMATVYDFYETVFGRKGFDGNNTLFPVVINNGALKNRVVARSTSLFSGGYLSMISLNNEYDKNVIAHEYTHSVEKSICHLIPSGESGILAEAIADIFGELSEAEESKDKKCDWVHTYRNIKDPEASDLPRIYLTDKNWDPTCSDLHKNSIVISHAAYLMSKELSNEQLAKLWYRAMLMMPSDCDFATCRTVTELAARSLSLTDSQLSCVGEAFNEVGIAAPAEDSDFITPGTFSLTVLDKYGNPYDNYSYHISGTKAKDAPQATALHYEETESVFDAAPHEITLDPGHYIVTVKNNVGAPDPIIFTIKVENAGKEIEIRLATNYAGAETDGLTLEWLTSQLFYTTYQCESATKFNSDGTFAEFYFVNDSGKITLDYLSYTGTFEISGNTVQLSRSDGYGQTLTYLSPAEHPDCEDEDRYQEAARMVDEDEYFLYEVGWVQEYDEWGEPYDDAAEYLVPGILEYEPTTPYYRAYLPYVQSADEAAYFRSTGLFYDLNADGTDELLLRYITETEEVHCAAYTVVDGVAQPIAEDRVVGHDDMVANDICVVQIDGKTCLLVVGEQLAYGDIDPCWTEWYLYEASNAGFRQTDHVKYYNDGTAVYTRNDAEITKEEYDALVASMELLQCLDKNVWCNFFFVNLDIDEETWNTGADTGYTDCLELFQIRTICEAS